MIGNINKNYSKRLTHCSPVLGFIEKSVIYFALRNMTGFYMKRKTGLKWVKLNAYFSHHEIIILAVADQLFEFV